MTLLRTRVTREIIGADGQPFPATSRRPPAVSTPTARLVSRTRARPAVAEDGRSVPHPGVRGDAAADASRSRAAEVPRVAGEISVAVGARRRRPGRCDRDVAATGLQHQAAA